MVQSLVIPLILFLLKNPAIVQGATHLSSDLSSNVSSSQDAGQNETSSIDPLFSHVDKTK